MMDIRLVSALDVDLICRHRAEMFLESGKAAADVSAMTVAFRAWLEPRLEDGRYFGFVADDRGQAVAGIGLMEIEWPPHPLHPRDDRRGYVLNLFVEPAFRRQGLARRLLDAADAEFKRRGVTYAILHATEAGLPLYEREGWSRTSEMAKAIG